MLAKLTADFEKATADKLRCQKEADATQATIQLANRLVGGLASENVRWAEAVAEYVKNICLLMLILFTFFSHSTDSWPRAPLFLAILYS